jgi:galactose mutarotase-like enzyme
MAHYSLSNNQLTVKINSFGAELCSVRSKSDHTEYIWQADSTVWARHAPNLFPIVGKLKEGNYKYHDQSYTLSQHGFARDQEFICIEETEQTLTFELAANEETLKHFPFHFSLQVSYVLQDDTLKVSYSVYNPDYKDLLMSLGAHPAFNCPMQPHETFEDYELQFDGLNLLTVNKLHEGLVTEETKVIHLADHKLHLNTTLFEKDALVLKGAQINHVRLSSTLSGHGVEMHCENWPYFGIWTKPGTSQFLCLEPWYGIADVDNANGTLEEKEGIINVASETHFNCFFSLKFL